MTSKAKATLATDVSTNAADNTSGDISASDVRGLLNDLRDSTLGGYGSLLIYNASTAQSLTTTSAKLTGWAANGSVSDNTTPDHSNDQISVAIAGDYLISFMLCGTGTSTDNYIFRPAVGGTPVSNVGVRFTNSGTGEFTVSGQCLVTLAASDLVSVYGESNQAGGSNFTPKYGQLIVKRAS